MYFKPPKEMYSNETASYLHFDNCYVYFYLKEDFNIR